MQVHLNGEATFLPGDVTKIFSQEKEAGTEKNGLLDFIIEK